MTHVIKNKPRRRKKDFKIRESIVSEFERLAPIGKQTAIVENLIVQWIHDQKREETRRAVEKAYTRSVKR